MAFTFIAGLTFSILEDAAWFEDLFYPGVGRSFTPGMRRSFSVPVDAGACLRPRGTPCWALQGWREKGSESLPEVSASVPRPRLSLFGGTARGSMALPPRGFEGTATLVIDGATPCHFIAEGHRAARAVSRDRVAQAGNERWIAETQALGRSQCRTSSSLDSRPFERARSRRRGRTTAALESVAKRLIWTAERAKRAPT